MLKNLIHDNAKKIIIISLVIALVGLSTYYIYIKLSVTASTNNTQNLKSVVVMRGDMDVKISGTGTIQPISRYDIVPLVKGNILKAPFEEGMEVNEGDLLYVIDDSDLSYTIEKTKNNMEKLKLSNQLTENSLHDLEIVAPIEGRIQDFHVKEGEQIGGNSKIATIVNDRKLKAVIPFNSSQIHNISIGSKAHVVVPKYMTYIDGIVTNISNIAKPSPQGTILYDVEIEIDNPGMIVNGLQVSAIIEQEDGDIVSPVNGTLSYSDESTIIAKTSGTAKEALVENNDWVNAGQKILELENDSLYVTSQRNLMDLKDLQLSLDSQLKQLNDYRILSPISGTIIKKNYKFGDTINTSNNNTILMTIADMTKMIFTIEVDELDISKIMKGQKVHITADALPDSSFLGEVTAISVEGKSQNGVTTYPVQVTIPEPGKLIPGMNVNAEILVESKNNVLYVPMAAVTKMKDKTFVLVQADGQSNIPTKNPNPQGSKLEQQRQNRTNTTQSPASQKNNTNPTTDIQRKEVTVGINNDDYIEIVGGLKEGDQVFIPTTSANSGNNSGFSNPNEGGIRIPGIGGGQRSR